MANTIDKWMIQVRKGIAELFILNALESGELYGYDISRLLESIPDLGVKSGTVYPLLSRLRTQGRVKTRLVESKEGPARKYYSLTSEGKKAAKQMNDYIKSILKESADIKNRGKRNG